MSQLFLFNNFILVVSIGLIIGLAYIVLRTNVKNKLNITFAFFSGACILWVFTNLMANLALSKSMQEYMFWTQASIVGPAFLPSIIPYFALSFPGNKIRLNNFILILFHLFTLINVILIPTKYNIESVKIINSANFESTFTPGPLYLIFAVSLLVTIFLSIYIFVKKNKGSTDKEKMQSKLVLIGIVLSVLSAVVMSVILPSFGIVTFINSSPASVIFFIGFSAFAIFEHQLVSIKTIIAEIVVFIISVVIFSEMFFSKSVAETLIRLTLLVAVLYAGNLLIKSTQKEIQQREALEILTKKLEDANTKLKEVDALKTEFISMASHELLTPISAIEGYLSMIFDEKLVKIEDENAKKYLDNVYKSSKRLARLVADLLNVSRIEQGRLLMQKADLDLKKIVEEVVAELNFKAKDKKQDVSIKISPHTEISTYADPDKIKEIMINLCGNSIKYTKVGGQIEVDISKMETEEVETRSKQMEDVVTKNETAPDSSLQNSIAAEFRKIVGENQIIISVKDNGLGLSNDDISHLFKKFSRVGDYTTQEVQGTGLGLYLSKALTEMQHGRIWAESEGRGKGSTFFLALPEIKCKNEIMKLDSMVKIAKDAKPLAKSEKNF